jgi:hypothetical protein
MLPLPEVSPPLLGGLVSHATERVRGTRASGSPETAPACSPVPETVPALARRLGVRPWLVRKLCDRLAGAAGLPRVGLHVRLINSDLADRIEAELRRLGRLPNAHAGGPNDAA